MANRSVRPKHIRNLRRLNSAAIPLLSLTGRPDPVRRPGRASTAAAADAAINLDDTESLFRPVSTGKLIRSSITLHMAGFGPMVDIGAKVMGSRLMEKDLVRRAVLGFTEHTFYNHFCGGADLSAARRTAERLWGTGLTAMLDYGLEHANDNESCDGNMEEIVETINSSKMFENSEVSFVVVKITAICPPKLLKRVSDLLRWEYKDNSLHLPWKLKSLPVFSSSSPFYHTPNRPQPLTPDEERDLQLAYQRLNKICERAVAVDIPLLIDAEDTSIQPAIDYFSYSAAVAYSRGDHDPIIFNTIQAYLKDAKDRMVIAKEAADEMGVPLGFKLVRGAYMSSEKRLADELGVESPIHDSIQDTHACYDECADYLLDEIACGSGSVVLATHNVQSGKMAASKAVNLGIRKNSPYLHFAQLYGMAEGLSFGLKNAGFKVSKYLPFGPVEHIMPYLLRRAEENRGLLSTSSLDRHLMR
ncbi:proline dehydrogenase 2 mitochondrial [Phtheirospermum japonicum]|uniref:Proline dehydrogenase n=1 Tax=Phtheirospermum japonicum TaxID=374723 RepID=A0A830C591_9LAMI|nr:proline dehydrogenase 2 mitochondrial [Phtheirospermum japonicum]